MCLIEAVDCCKDCSKSKAHACKGIGCMRTLQEGFFQTQVLQAGFEALQLPFEQLLAPGHLKLFERLVSGLSIAVILVLVVMLVGAACVP